MTSPRLISGHNPGNGGDSYVWENMPSQFLHQQLQLLERLTSQFKFFKLSDMDCNLGADLRLSELSKCFHLFPAHKDTTWSSGFILSTFHDLGK